MAGKARNWDTLSAAYRKRLERAGITKRQYESGVSLEKARGHGQTPEHPERAREPEPGKPDKYKRYRDKIKKTIDYIQEFKESKWGNRPKWNAKRSEMNVEMKVWNAKRSEMNVRKDPGTGKPRGVKDLQFIKAMVDIAKRDTWMDWHGIVALDYDYEDAFYYH